MQRELSFRKSEDGVSPIIGTILILGIMVSITGTMLVWGIPQIQQSEAYAIYTSAQNNFLNFDADMDQVILQGTGHLALQRFLSAQVRSCFVRIWMR